MPDPDISLAKQAENKRLAAALRENLKRRKVQLRERASLAEPPPKPGAQGKVPPDEAV